ncbi:MAG: hypothetical protein ACLPQS_08285, partial [Acidimicrobiales bacterium]
MQRRHSHLLALMAVEERWRQHRPLSHRRRGIGLAARFDLVVRHDERTFEDVLLQASGREKLPGNHPPRQHAARGDTRLLEAIGKPGQLEDDLVGQ